MADHGQSNYCEMPDEVKNWLLKKYSEVSRLAINYEKSWPLQSNKRGGGGHQISQVVFILASTKV